MCSNFKDFQYLSFRYQLKIHPPTIILKSNFKPQRNIMIQAIISNSFIYLYESPALFLYIIRPLMNTDQPYQIPSNSAEVILCKTKRLTRAIKIQQICIKMPKFLIFFWIFKLSSGFNSVFLT